MIDASSKSTVAGTLQPRTSDQNILLAAKGGGIIFGGALFTYGSRLVIGILLARFLGAEQLGLYFLALAAAVITAGFASLGLEPAMVRYVSLFNSRRDAAGLWGTIQVGLGFTAIMSLLLGVGLYALASPIAEQLFQEARLAPLLRLASLLVLFHTLGNIIAAATRGFNKMQYTVIAQNISQPILKLVLIVLLVLSVGLNAARAVTLHILAVVAAFLMLLYFLNHLFPLKRSLRIRRCDLKEILRFSLPIYSARLIETFGGNVQIILLGALNTVTTVGVFAVASQINLIGKMFHNSIASASASVVSELYDQGERTQMTRLYQTVTKWTFTFNLPLLLIIILFPEPLLSIFGEDFVGGAIALTILAWGNLINAGTGICGLVIDMTGNTTLKLFNSIVIFALTMGLNLLLIPRWGLVGAAVAASVADVIVNLLRLSEVFILFRLLPYRVDFLKPVAAGLVALVVLMVFGQWLTVAESLVSIVINVVFLLALYVGMLVLLGFSQEDRVVLAGLRRRISTMLSRS